MLCADILSPAWGQERGQAVGQEVGYQVRFDSAAGPLHSLPWGGAVPAQQLTWALLIFVISTTPVLFLSRPSVGSYQEASRHCFSSPTPEPPPLPIDRHDFLRAPGGGGSAANSVCRIFNWEGGRGVVGQHPPPAPVSTGGSSDPSPHPLLPFPASRWGGGAVQLASLGRMGVSPLSPCLLRRVSDPPNPLLPLPANPSGVRPVQRVPPTSPPTRQAVAPTLGSCS